MNLYTINIDEHFHFTSVQFYAEIFIVRAEPQYTAYFKIYNDYSPRWRHQMDTFSASVALCSGDSPVTGEFPLQRPVARSFDVFFDLRLE